MDCRNVEFSPKKSAERIDRALEVFPQRLLMRILAFALYLLGANRKTIAELVKMPTESVKTYIRIALRDGFPALHDRRLTEAPVIANASPIQPQISVIREEDKCILNFGKNVRNLKIPIEYKLQAKVVLLSFLNSGLLSLREIASILEISPPHCRELARKLKANDVGESLIDKRQGQKFDFRVGPAQKAEIIRQFAARTITGHSTTSEILSKFVKEKDNITKLSARTIRWHVKNLGLSKVKSTLPNLVEELKKNF